MRNRPKIFKDLLFLIVLSFLSGCTTVYNPATGRTESLLYDTGEEVRLGDELDKELQKKLKISDSFLNKARVERIGERIARASDRQDLSYHFRVVIDEDLNAFAIPGGYIYVDSGLIEAATDDELACVLAHEVGHVAAKHSIKQLQAAIPYQVTMAIIAGATKNAAVVQLADTIIANPVFLHYSRNDELFADKLAVRYAKRAKFDPNGMITFFEKLKEELKRKGAGLEIEILSSHPDLDKRIEFIKEEIRSSAE